MGTVPRTRIATRWLSAVLLALTMSLAGIWHAAAEPAEVDLQLVLAIDASLSIDAEEAQLQRQGYIAALTDPKIVRAIRAGPTGQIAVFYFEWASEIYQRVVVDWTVIKDEASARARWTEIAPDVVGRSRVGVALLPNGADHHARQHDASAAVAALAYAARPDRKSTRLNSSHSQQSRMPSSA